MDIPDTYETTNLYVATIKLGEECEYKNSRFTFPMIDSKGVYQEVYASENKEDNFGYMVLEDSMFEVLSSMTSPDNPMYVVGTGECVYYVIGDTAYARRNYGFISYDRLPQIAMPEEEVIVVEIPLGAEG